MEIVQPEIINKHKALPTVKIKLVIVGILDYMPWNLRNL